MLVRGYDMKYELTIKKLREKMFVTQEELANILLVSPITVNRWETGKFKPSIKMKKILNELFIKYGMID